MRATTELHELESGQLLTTHVINADCAVRYCTFHNPSSHPLASAPRIWDPSQSIILRVCPHEIGHPDPDDTRIEVLIDCVCNCDCCGYSHNAGQGRRIR